MAEITVTGMVLSVMPIGEYDRRVLILSRERGKFSAFARGARRQNSPLLGATNPFCFGEFKIYEGRSSNTISSAKISNYFEELRDDVEAAYYGFYFLDLADYMSREGMDEAELLKLLYQSLRALLNPHIPNRLIRYVYELKALCINGEGPEVTACVSCGDTAREHVFSVRRGGLICRECLRSGESGRELSGSTLYTLQYIVSSPVEKLYQFTVTDEVLDELGEVVTDWMKEYVGKSFKSLEILETIL